MTKEALNITLDEELLQEIDRRRGLAPRSAFINELVKLGLKEKLKR